MEQAEALTKYREYVKTNPSDKEGARRSFYDTFKVDPENTFSKPKGEVSRMAGERLKHMNPNAPEGPGMIERGLGKVVGTETAARMAGEAPAAAQMIGMAAAPEFAVPKAAALAPKMLAYGQSALSRILVGTTAAAATKTAAEGIAEGIHEAKQASMYGVFGETAAGLLGGIARIGGKAFESVLLSAANQSSKGARIVGNAETQASQVVERMVKDRSADVTAPYSKFVDALAKIPRGKGSAGEKLAGHLSGPVSELHDAVVSDLKSVGPEGLPNLRAQPMDALVTMHSRANQLAWGVGKETPAPARKAVQDFADDLRATIKKNMTPEEGTVFEAAKSITKDTVEWGLGKKLAGFMVRRAFPSVVGLGTGLATHSYGAGAAAYAGAEVLEQKVSPVVLQYMVTNNKMAFQKAIAEAAKNPSTAEAKLQVAATALARYLPKDLKDGIISLFEMPGGEARAEEAPANIREGQKFIEKIAPGSYGDQKTQEKLGMRRPASKPTPTPVKAKDQKTIPPPGDPNEPLWLKAMRRQREINR